MRRSFLALILCAVAWTAASVPSQAREARDSVTVALDWTPNTNHTGIYVARDLGYYKAAGIDVKILPYASTAPETLVSHGKADFGFSYSAGIAFARAGGAAVTSVFAVLQHTALEIGVRADRGDIRTPKDLDGKVYAGFGTPDEKPLLQTVIRHAGGTGTFKDVTLNTSAYDAVYRGKADRDREGEAEQRRPQRRQRVVPEVAAVVPGDREHATRSRQHVVADPAEVGVELPDREQQADDQERRQDRERPVAGHQLCRGRYAFV